MKRMRLMLLTVICALTAAYIQPAFADGVADCEAACDKDHQECVAKAKEMFVNDIEVEDAVAVCNRTRSDCKGVCVFREQRHEFDAPPEPSQSPDPNNPDQNQNQPPL